MAGKKKFINNTGKDINIILMVRKSANPKDHAGKKEFSLKNKQTQYVKYGDSVNIYLNGISVFAIADGDSRQQTEIVITRGSQLDNELNMNDTVEFTFSSDAFHISTRNTWTV